MHIAIRFLRDITGVYFICKLAKNLCTQEEPLSLHYHTFGDNRALYEVCRTFVHEGKHDADNGTHERYYNAISYASVQNIDLSAFLQYITSGKATSVLTQSR